MLNGLDLFSGGGGFAEGLEEWVRPVTYCEIDTKCQAVLLQRMRLRQLSHAPIWDDITTFGKAMLPGYGGVDFLYGGFPCQDISIAGHGAGLDGKRSGLFFELLRLVSECRPRFVMLENTPAIVNRGLARILLGLNALGYDARWTIVSAAEVGAVHIRERWFLLAHANGVRLREECGQKIGWDYAQRPRPLESDGSSSPRGNSWASKRLTKPRVDRTGDGMAHRVHRHRILGNGVVPAQAREAFGRLMGLK